MKKKTTKLPFCQKIWNLTKKCVYDVVVHLESFLTVSRRVRAVNCIYVNHVVCTIGRVKATSVISVPRIKNWNCSPVNGFMIMSVKSSKGLAVLKLSEHCTNRRKTPPEDTTQFKKVEYPVYHVSYFINFHESSKRMLNSENINILFFIYFLYFLFSML